MHTRTTTATIQHTHPRKAGRNTRDGRVSGRFGTVHASTLFRRAGRCVKGSGGGSTAQDEPPGQPLTVTETRGGCESVRQSRIRKRERIQRSQLGGHVLKRTVQQGAYPQRQQLKNGPGRRGRHSTPSPRPPPHGPTRAIATRGTTRSRVLEGTYNNVPRAPVGVNEHHDCRQAVIVVNDECKVHDFFVLAAAPSKDNAGRHTALHTHTHTHFSHMDMVTQDGHRTPPPPRTTGCQQPKTKAES
jgi:hypothetical protein